MVENNSSFPSSALHLSHVDDRVGFPLQSPFYKGFDDSLKSHALFCESVSLASGAFRKGDVLNNSALNEAVQAVGEYVGWNVFR